MRIIAFMWLLLFSPAMAGDNLAGTPSSAALVSAEQDLAYLHSRTITFDRLQTQLRPTSVPFYGDSITEAMDGSQIGPNVVLMGINGSTMRDFLGRVNRSLINGTSIVHNSPAAGFAMGVNDTQYEYATGNPQDLPFLIDEIAAWMTGKWVIIKILPINESMYWTNGGQTAALTNARIDAVNAHTQAVFGNRPGFVIVDAKAALAPNGQLLPAYTIDGLHPSAAGYAVLYPMIQAAFAQLAVIY